MATQDTDFTLELYLTGLRNAHALENEALAIMNRQVERLESYPEVLKRLRAHIAETEKQRERLHTILHEFDEDPSTFKDLGGKLMGSLAALGHSVAGDEIIKNTFANYAFENYEIAFYKGLIYLADKAGRAQHVGALEQSLGEEIAMASWIEEHTEAVLERFLQLTAAGKTAKV